jgi:hypothetical protein
MTGTLAIVPMRHNSERVPGKNYRPLGGIPLYHHVVRTRTESFEQCHRPLLVVGRLVFHRSDAWRHYEESLTESAAQALGLKAAGDDAVTADLECTFGAGINKVGYIAFESKVVQIAPIQRSENGDREHLHSSLGGDGPL